jgi:hypothetical protein
MQNAGFRPAPYRRKLPDRISHFTGPRQRRKARLQSSCPHHPFAFDRHFLFAWRIIGSAVLYVKKLLAAKCRGAFCLLGLQINRLMKRIASEHSLAGYRHARHYIHRLFFIKKRGESSTSTPFALSLLILFLNYPKLHPMEKQNKWLFLEHAWRICPDCWVFRKPQRLHWRSGCIHKMSE